MTITREARDTLASLMDSRLRELRLRWQDVADRGGISLKTLQSARTGTAGIRPRTQWGIEAGMQWPAGFVQWVLDGHDPAGFTGGDSPQPCASPLRAVPPPEPPDPAEVVTIPADMAFLLEDIGVSAIMAAAQQVYTRACGILARDPQASGQDIFPGEVKAPLIWDACRRGGTFTLDECVFYATAAHLKEKRRNGYRRTG